MSQIKAEINKKEYSFEFSVGRATLNGYGCDVYVSKYDDNKILLRVNRYMRYTGLFHTTTRKDFDEILEGLCGASKLAKCLDHYFGFNMLGD